MLSGCLDDALDVSEIGGIVLTPRRHVADGWQHSAVVGFHNDGLGKKDANPVSRVKPVQFFVGWVHQDATNGVLA